MKKILLIFVLMFVLLVPVAYASPDQVKVGVYMLNLGKFDVATGLYTADFYLSLKCEDVCSPENFEILNGKATSIEKIVDLPGEKFYRIQATLNSPVNLEKFPFDSQKLTLIIEDKKYTSDRLVYVPSGEETGIDDSIAFTGWNIDGWSTNVTAHEYSIYNETFSKYTYTINISKIAWSSFIKTFLPVLFIVIVVLFSFTLDPDKITTRISLCSSSLIAAVMFHIAISNQIPAVGYMTFADKFMILTYFILITSFIINLVIVELSESKDKARKKLADEIHRNTEYSMLIITPILYLLLFWLFI